MNSCFESPKNRKMINPLDYNYNDDVKERHYKARYYPDMKDVENTKRMSNIEIENFAFNSNCSNTNINNDIYKNNENYNKRMNDFKFAIKSIII